MSREIIGITGGTGVLGNYFICKYKNYKYDIFQGDITKYDDVKFWIKNTKAKYVLHFASKVSTNYVKENYMNSLNVNYRGTRNLVNSILTSNKKIWLFFSSSSHVYKSSNKKLKEKDPTYALSLYGKTKLKTENYLLKISKNKQIKICIGRIFSFTHKKQSTPYLIPSLFKKINQSKHPINLKDLNHDRDFCHIDDLCRAVNLLKKKNSTGIFNIGTGKATNLFRIVKLINRENKKIFYKKNDKKTSLVANIDKIKKIGFKPKYGIRKIIFDMRCN